MEAICGALEAKDDEQVFYRMILDALNKHEGDPQFMRLLFHSALEGHALSEIFIEENIVPIYEFLSAYIAQRQKDGAIRANINPRIIVRAMVGTKSAVFWTFPTRKRRANLRKYYFRELEIKRARKARNIL